MIDPRIPDGALVPGGEGQSAGLDRADLSEFIAKWEVQLDLPDKLRHPRTAYLDVFFASCVVLNVATMCMEHFEGNVKIGCSDKSICPNSIEIMDTSWRDLLNNCEVILTAVFNVEAILKIISMGFMRYFVQLPNRVDLTLVFLSDVSLVLTEAGNGIPVNISLLRVLRILRAFRLVNRFAHLRVLFTRIAIALVPSLEVALSLLFTLGAISLFGMQVFMCPRRPETCDEDERSLDRGGQCSIYDATRCAVLGGQTICPLFKACAFSPELNFNTFWNGFISASTMVLSTNWEDLMYASMRAYPDPWGPISGVAFFVVIQVFVVRVMLNLSLSVVLHTFDLNDEEKLKIQESCFRLVAIQKLRYMFERTRETVLLRKIGDKGQFREADKEVGVVKFDPDDPWAELDDADDPPPPEHRQQEPMELIAQLRRGAAAAGDKPPPPPRDVTIFLCLPPPTPSVEYPHARRNLRGYARLILENRWFEHLVLVNNIISCFIIGLQSPVQSMSVITSDRVNKAQIFITLVYTLEAVLRVLQHGIYWEHPDAYLRTWRNRIDAFVLVAVYASIIFTAVPALQTLRILRVFRIITSLQLLARLQSVQEMFAALQSSWTDTMNILLVLLFSIGIFTLLGVNLFSGVLYNCNDGGLSTNYLSAPCFGEGMCDNTTRRWISPIMAGRMECSGTFLRSLDMNGQEYAYPGSQTQFLTPRAWRRPFFSFDNFGTSLLCVFSIISLDGWGQIAYDTMNSVEIGVQPVYMQNPGNYIFFVIAVLWNYFFVMQLYIGVFVDNLRSKRRGALHDLQINWRELDAKITATKPRITLRQWSSFQRRIQVLVDGDYFQDIMMCVALVNMTFLASEHFRQPPYWADALNYVNLGCLFMYTVELVGKLLAYGRDFVRNYWNLADVVVFIVCLQDIALKFNNINVSPLRILQMLRLLRGSFIVKILRYLPNLGVLLEALWASKTYILAISALLLMTVFMAACFAVQMFGGVRYGKAIGPRSNFDTTWAAFVVLSRVGTGSGFTAAVVDCSVEPPACTICDACVWDEIGGTWVDYSDCGSGGVAALFFVVYVVVVRGFLIQMYSAVLVVCYEEFVSKSVFVIKDHHVKTFQEEWEVLDPSATGELPISMFRWLIERLHRAKNPMGTAVIADEFKFRLVRSEVMAFGGGGVGREMIFSEVLRILSLHVVGHHALPHYDMLRRQDRLALLAQVSMVSKAMTLYGQRRTAASLRSGGNAKGYDTSVLSAAIKDQESLTVSWTRMYRTEVDLKNRRISQTQLIIKTVRTIQIELIKGLRSSFATVAEKAAANVLDPPLAAQLRLVMQQPDETSTHRVSVIAEGEKEPLDIRFNNSFQVKEFLDLMKTLRVDPVTGYHADGNYADLTSWRRCATDALSDVHRAAQRLKYKVD